MRPLLALLPLLAFSLAHGAPNTESLPAGAVGIVSVDIATFRASKVGQAFEQASGGKAKQAEASRQLNEQLGVDSKKDLQEIVIAIYPGADGKVAEKNASGVVLLRGKFLPARINSFGQTNRLPSKPAGRFQAWEAGPFIEKISGEKTKDNAKDAYVVAHSESLVIVAGAEFLDQALTAADRHEQAALLPPTVAAKFAAARSGWLFLYADTTKMKGAQQELGVESLSLVLGENATDLQLAAVANFAGADKASQMRKQLTGLQAMATIGLLNQEGKSPEEQENLALLSELVQKIRLGGADQAVTLDVDLAAEKAAKALTKALEKSRSAGGK